MENQQQDETSKNVNGVGMQKNLYNKPAKKGFGGWLITFVVIFSVLLPIFAIQGVSQWGKISSYVMRRYSGLGTLKTLDMFFGIGLAVFGIYMGIALAKKLVPGTIKLAEVFLMTYGAASIILAIFVFSLNLPSSVNSYMTRWVLVRLAVATAFFLYFKKSKRVQATYLEVKQNL